MTAELKRHDSTRGKYKIISDWRRLKNAKNRETNFFQTGDV